MFVSSGVFMNTGFNVFTPVVLSYAFDGDTNGVFHYRGRLNNTTSWSNPHDSGAINLSASSIGGNINVLVNRAISTNSDFYTNTLPGQFVTVDLNPYKLVCTTVSIQNTDSFITINWDFQGSNDNFNWTTLNTVTGNPTTSYQWNTKSISNITAWRHFRILMNGFDSTGTQYLTFSEFELYGTLSL